METDQQKKPSNKGPWEGLTVQGVGGALGVMWVLHQKSKGIYYEAAYELALGTIITATIYLIYFLFGPRINRWRNRQ